MHDWAEHLTLRGCGPGRDAGEEDKGRHPVLGGAYRGTSQGTRVKEDELQLD